MGGPLDGQSKEFSGTEYRVPQAMAATGRLDYRNYTSRYDVSVAYHVYTVKYLGGREETPTSWGSIRSEVSIPVMAYMGMRVD